MRTYSTHGFSDRTQKMTTCYKAQNSKLVGLMTFETCIGSIVTCTFPLVMRDKKPDLSTFWVKVRQPIPSQIGVQ